jgi:hypothetical protein
MFKVTGDGRGVLKNAGTGTLGYRRVFDPTD